MSTEQKEWADLAIELYDKLTGRGAEITYDFDQMEIGVPSRTGNGASHAVWRLNGKLAIRTRDNAS